MSGILKDILIGVVVGVLVAAIIGGLKWFDSFAGDAFFDGQRLVSFLAPEVLFTGRYYFGVPLLAFSWGTFWLFRLLRRAIRSFYYSGESYGGFVYTTPDSYVHITLDRIKFEVDCVGTTAQFSKALCAACDCELILSSRWILPGVKYSCPSCGQTTKSFEPSSRTDRKVKLLAEQHLRKNSRSEA